MSVIGYNKILIPLYWYKCHGTERTSGFLRWLASQYLFDPNEENMVYPIGLLKGINAIMQTGTHKYLAHCKHLGNGITIIP